MPKRSKELIEIGYFLSREGKENPPSQLETTSWSKAYLLFYNKLNEGRTPTEFKNSLKNVRDQFDSYFPKTKREGWKEKKDHSKPSKLSNTLQKTFDKYKNSNSDEIWERIKRFIDTSFDFSAKEINDAFLPEKFDYYKSKIIFIEGKKKVKISTFIERNPKLRKLAINYHGTNCSACGFNFKEFYGAHGDGFIEIHHLEPLYKETHCTRETNFIEDLTPLCANCHSMVHRKKNQVLTLNELKEIIKNNNESTASL
jgi:predicted restriction endonuclease